MPGVKPAAPLLLPADEGDSWLTVDADDDGVEETTAGDADADDTGVLLLLLPCTLLAPEWSVEFTTFSEVLL